MCRVIFLVLFSASLLGCQSTLPSKEWYRGNTHTHTELCGHADSSPEAVTKFYHDLGYNFLILSEHNKFIDPTKVKMPENKRDDFILIPGQEVTGKRNIHTTAMNTTGIVPWGATYKDKQKIIQKHVDDVQAANGVAILNHPNWKTALTAEDIYPVDRLYMFELFNSVWANRKFPDDHEKHPIEEVLWDRLLTKGMVIYGVCADDAHKLKKLAVRADNPGKGWVMVRSASLSPDAITAAMWHGDFYGSTGVYLKEYNVESDQLSIKVDVQGTQKEMQRKILREGKRMPKATPGFIIELIGESGKILQTVEGTEAVFPLSKAQKYYRVKVTYIQKHAKKGYEGYYAWCQPVFTDGRLGKLKKLQHKYLENSHNHTHDGHSHHHH